MQRNISPSKIPFASVSDPTLSQKQYCEKKCWTPTGYTIAG